ncbi:hypothetical protein BD413DRAFT_482852 [Trametes elegans]|nr:hypothetical protein BD413DRAFT_482852 [Trametes elegans]
MAVDAILHPDILSRLFEHLSPGPVPGPRAFPTLCSERRIRRHTLAISARVCRAFYGAALDVLWHAMDDITPLLSVLPTYTTNGGVFTGGITDENWQRFQVYASRVRQLVMSRDERYGRSPSETAWMVLMQRSHGPLLPRLEHLAVSCSVGALMMLLSPTLTHLDWRITVSFNPNRGLADLLLEMVEPHFAHLKSLTLYEYDVANHKLPGKIDVCALTHLHELSVDHHIVLTASTLRSLVMFPYLRKLALMFELTPEELSALAQTKLEPGFFQLQELNLHAKLEEITAFLEATEPPCLDSLSITRQCSFFRLPREPLYHALHMVYTKIPRRIRALHLRLLNVDGYYPNEPEAQDVTASRLVPPALQTLPDLRELTISVEGLGTRLKDEHLRTLCAAWPALTRFEYTASAKSSGVRAPTRPPTFGTLLDFARAHPALVQLVLPTLSAEGMPEPGFGSDGASGARATPPHRGLRLLRFCGLARKTSIPRLALALDRAFPALDVGHLDSSCRSPLGGVEDPDVLMLALITLQAARKLRSEATVCMPGRSSVVRPASPGPASDDQGPTVSPQQGH